MAEKTLKRARGRPSAFTPDRKRELCERVALGETVRKIAADEHMPAESTVYLTLAGDPAFAAAYARAREAQCIRWEDDLLEIADDGTNDYTTREGRDGETIPMVNHDHIQRSKVRIDTRKWLMMKRLPKKYGDKLTQEHVGQDGGPGALALGDGSAHCVYSL